MFGFISGFGVFFVIVYSILIGIFMIGFWSVALLKGMIPEEEKPWAITFHLFSEFSTAILLVVSGLGLWFKVGWLEPFSLISLGMLLYIVIYSPGYYLQKKNKPMGLLFGFLIISTILAIICLLLK
ncbi:MAG: hypothetical protein ACW99F_04550 [Candidatus Hodarchaeales archaeon]|jgi:hypothetical protein